MGTPLFRREVLENQAGKFAGSIVLVQPIPMRLAAVVAALLVIAVLGFLVTGHYTRNVTVSGVLVPVAGATRSTSPQFGRIVAMHVREGDVVHEGQVLFELSSERDTLGGGVETRTSNALLAQRELAAVETEAQLAQLSQKRQELHARRAIALNEAKVLEQERELQNRRIELAADLLQRSRSLREQGFLSVAQLAQSETEQLEHQAKLQALERSRLASLREQAQTDLELTQLERQAEIVRLQGKRNQAVLEQGLAEHEARMRVRILAQAAGKLTAIAVRPGDTVDAGAILATVVPQDSVFEAQLAVPSASIGFAATGQTVRMRVAAYPYQRFGYLTGKVRVVENGPLAEGLAASKDTPEPLYRIAVKLDRQSIRANGQARTFKPGMRLEVVIRQDRRRLIHWMLDPVRSAIKSPMT